MRLLLVFVFALLSLCTLEARNPEHITMQDGLPTQNIYSVMEDSRGFVWFCTDRGVCRYNGQEIETFGVDDGLSDFEVFNAFEDSKGRIWFGSFNGQLSYFENEHFYTSRNSSLPELDNSSFIKFIHEPTPGYLIFQTYQDGLFIMNPSGKVEHLFRQTQIMFSFSIEDFVRLILVDRTPGNSILDLSFKNNQLQIDTFCTLPFYSQVSNALLKKDHIQVFNTFGRNPDQIIIYKNQKLDSIPLNLEARQVYFQMEDDSSLYLGTDNGLYQYHATTFQLISHEFAGDQISYRTRAKNGIIYYTTLQNGVYRMPSSSGGRRLLNKPAYAISLSLDTHQVWVGSRDAVYAINANTGNTNTYPIPSKFGKNNVVYHLRELTNENWLVASGRQSYILNDGHLTPIIRHAGIRESVILGDTLFLAKGTGVFADYLPYWQTGRYLENPNDAILGNEWVKSIIIYQNKLVVGTNSGVFFRNSAGTFDRLNGIRCRITSLATQQNLLVVGTASEGLYFVRNDSIVLNLISELPSVNDVVFLDQNRLLIANDQGVFELQFNPDQLQDYTLFYRFPIPYCNALLLGNKHQVFVASHDGLFLEDIQRPMPDETPRLYIRNISVNGKRSSLENLTQLNYDQNRINFSLMPVSYLRAGKLFYEYRLNEGEWIRYFGTELNLGELNPGNYLVQFRCSNYIQTSAIVSVPLIIKAAWFQRNDIRFLSVTVLLIILFFLIVSYNSRNRKKAELAIEIAELKQKAFRAQINPHFLFNVLNSIQLFFLKNRTYDGQEYLGKFAKLMRSILNHSDETFLTLQEEIDRLKLYLELEQIRADHAFRYAIHLENTIEPYQLNYPSMIIQPFLENAIWHGLQEGDNEIALLFRKEDDVLITEIRDNGPGISPEALEQSQSKGIKLIRDRIHAMNAAYDSDIHLDFIIDHGTTVQIRIPLNLLL